MITKLLVANRGEIACRVFRTCRDMGIGTVAVYSDADADAMFVTEADIAVPLGGQTPAESYLRIDAIIAAATSIGADAIHPGYGFLSENADLALACRDAGIAFVGPSPEAIEAMGSKLTARTMMEQSGVPVLPGRDLTGVPDDRVVAVADEVGWPVLVKASFGGGGRGMRVVRHPEELVEAIEAARREASSAFGDDTVFLEHYVDSSRHIEIQIFGDAHGSIAHLNERECSIQRRHQKIIEESPSPAVDSELRARMGEAAVAAARALDYVGAGTVEFLLAPDGRFFFLEVNTRLQVEHPVTEMVTGLDLVRMQIEVADGGRLPEGVDRITPVGHAIEARLYAEDPTNDFLPAGGRLHRFDIPDEAWLRVDSGFRAGDVVSSNYDPMLAKVIAYGATREEAVRRLSCSLQRTRLLGIASNRAMLVGVLDHPGFMAGEFDTDFLTRFPAQTLIGDPPQASLVAAVLAAAMTDQARARSEAVVQGSVSSGFRTVRSQPQRRSYRIGDREVEVAYSLGRSASFQVDRVEHQVDLRGVGSTRADLVVDGVRLEMMVQRVDDRVWVMTPFDTIGLTDVPRLPITGDADDSGSLVAPMPGTVVRINVAPGTEVAAGDTILVLEAMKMEHGVKATRDAVVRSVPVQVGVTVDTGTVLVVLEEEAPQDG